MKPLLVAAAAAMMLGLTAQADNIKIMAIGDSITWGYDSAIKNDPKTSGGWRAGLETNLQNLGSPNTFSFIGIRGDGSTSTVFGEFSGQADDNVGRLHEGYSGWSIDAWGHPSSSKSYSDPTGISSDPDSIFYDGGKRSGIANHLRSHAVTGGTIDPGNLNGHFSGPADVVMLSIGINDVIEFTGFTNSPYDNISQMVEVLSNLIDTIVSVIPTSSKLLVSNLTPLGNNPFPSSSKPGGYNSNGVPANDDINLFNSLLLDLFGGAFNADAFATHESFSNVYLLDAYSALTNLNTDLVSDNVHPSTLGYAKLANFYTDSFVALGLTTIPEPASAVLLVFGGAMVLGRPRRRAA